MASERKLMNRKRLGLGLSFLFGSATFMKSINERQISLIAKNSSKSFDDFKEVLKEMNK